MRNIFEFQDFIRSIVSFNKMASTWKIKNGFFVGKNLFLNNLKRKKWQVYFCPNVQCAAVSTQVCEISVPPHVRVNLLESGIPRATMWGNSPTPALTPLTIKRFAFPQSLGTLIGPDDEPAREDTQVTPQISSIYSSHSEI